MSTFNGDNNYCQGVMRAFQEMQKQAAKSYKTIRNRLGEYTKIRFNNTTREAYEMWRKHDLELEHPYRNVLVRDFDIMPDRSIFRALEAEPITKQTLMSEMMKVYKTLKTLDLLFKEVIRNRKDRESLLRHDFGNDGYRKLEDFFAETYRHIGFDLEETKNAMNILDIEVPNMDEPLKYNNTTPALEWLMTQEYLSIVQYLRVFYDVVLSKCNEQHQLQ